MKRSLFTRGVATLLAAAGMLSIVPAYAAVFSDVGMSTSYRTAIEALQKKGILKGYANGTFGPMSRINRAEFLEIALRARGIELKSGGNCFPDVTDQWFAKAVCTAKAEGIVSGYPDGYFHPDRDIGFDEAGKIMALAFKQQIEQYSPDWYEPYARALESSKAIPTTIKSFTAKVTRGEMAEMIWRLMEDKKDQPSLAYMNVKYPELSVNMASDTIQLAKSCADLQAFTTEAMRTSGYGYGGDVMLMRGDIGGAAAPAANRATTAESAQGSDGKSADQDYSQTNVQVAGVDEADIVKTDGTFVYVVRNDDRSRVSIVRAHPASQMKEETTIDMTADGMSAQEMYVEDDRLIVIGQKSYAYPMPGLREDSAATSERMIAPGYYPWYTQRTDVRIYDIQNPVTPKLLRTLSFDGNQISSRRIGDKVYLVMQQGAYWAHPLATERTNPVPLMQDSNVGKDVAVARCADVAILPHIPSPQYLIVAVIPTDNAKAEVKTDVMLGSAENIYSSLNNLYVAHTEWNYAWRPDVESSEKTTLYRFAFTDDGVDLKAQGSVPGRILNQFSMDESDNTFRIATTKGQVWNTGAPSSNNLYVLNDKLEKVGDIEDIAPGEQIYSVRFLGDRAYMVTFKKIDPFFVIDLKDPRAPKILGKLKIPGYSDYLHPYDEDHVIGFGKEAVEAKEGDFAWYQGMKIALFDVSDVANPKELHKTEIGDRGTESPLLHNHKALLFDKSRNLLSFPVMVATLTDEQKKDNTGSAYGSPSFQGAYVYELTLKDGFKLKGTITHYDDPETFKKAGDFWYAGDRDVERILRIEDSLVSIARNGIRSYGVANVKEEGRIEYKK